MASRRGNGEGAIFKAKDRAGWVGQLDLGAGPDGKRVRRKVRGRTKSEVATKLRDLRNAEANRPALSGQVSTLGELLQRWLDTVAAARVSQSTLDGYRHQVDQHIAPALGAIHLDRLTPEHLDDYFLRMARQGYSRGSLVKHRSMIGQAVRWGLKRRHIGWDVASLAELPPADVFAAAKPKQVRVARSLTRTEAQAFLAATEGRRNGAALVVALTLGLRPGELLALCWEDLDLDAGTLHVHRAWKGSGETRHLGPPKTRGSVRTLSLPPAVAVRLRDHRAEQLRGRLRTNVWAADGPDLVFPTSVGTPLDTANLRRLIAEVATEAGIEGKLSAYDLRHTATSLLSEAGVRNELLADLLGHVDTRMVERHYRHRLSESVTVAVGPMSDLLAASG